MMTNFLNEPVFLVVFTAVICFGISGIIAIIFKNKDKKLKEKDAMLPNEREQKDQEFKRVEELLEAQNAQILSLSCQLEEYTKMRHDFRHELLLLREFAETGDRESLEKYLPDIKIDDKINVYPICYNTMINTFLQHYFNKAKAADITIDANIEADDNLWLDAADTGVLFGNLLENALTAAAEPGKKENRLIRIRTKQTSDLFIIVLGNTFGNARNKNKDGIFESTKQGHKAIGIKSINSIAQKYDGYTKFLVKDNMFMSYVVLLKPVK